MAPGPADADGSQDDARHTQSHLHHGEQEQAPQDLAAGAHPAPGISPGPAGGGWRGGGQREERSPLLSRPLCHLTAAAYPSEEELEGG